MAADAVRKGEYFLTKQWTCKEGRHYGNNVKVIQNARTELAWNLGIPHLDIFPKTLLSARNILVYPCLLHFYSH